MSHMQEAYLSAYGVDHLSSRQGGVIDVNEWMDISRQASITMDFRSSTLSSKRQQMVHQWSNSFFRRRSNALV